MGKRVMEFLQKHSLMVANSVVTFQGQLGETITLGLLSAMSFLKRCMPVQNICTSTVVLTLPTLRQDYRVNSDVPGPGISC